MAGYPRCNLDDQYDQERKNQMLTTVEVEIELSAKETIRRLFPLIAREQLDKYKILYVHTEGTEYGRKPVQIVTIRLRRELEEGKIL